MICPPLLRPDTDHRLALNLYAEPHLMLQWNRTYFDNLTANLHTTDGTKPVWLSRAYLLRESKFYREDVLFAWLTAQAERGSRRSYSLRSSRCCAMPRYRSAECHCRRSIADSGFGGTS